MNNTYNTTHFTSLASPCKELVVTFQPATQGTVYVESINQTVGLMDETDPTEMSEQYYANDAKSLFYSLIRQGYSVI